MAKQFKTWDQYTTEAEQDPFELPVSKDETLKIEKPNGTAMMRAAQAFRNGDPEAMLHSLTGDHWPRVQELISHAPFSAMKELAMDLQVYFEIMEEVVLDGPGGGSVRERDPRKIRALQNQGYKMRGEA